MTSAVALNSTDASVAITLEQSMLRGNVTISDAGGVSPVLLPRGISSFPLTGNTTAKLLTHNGIVYAALATPHTASTLRVSIGTQNGSWASINAECSKAIVHKDVFKLWLDLGPAPLANASGVYGIFPGVTPVQASGILSQLRIVANMPQRQVVVRGDGSTTHHHTAMAVVYGGNVVFTRAEMGYGISTNGTLIVSVSRTPYSHPVSATPSNNVQSVSARLDISFSRPVGGAGVVRLLLDDPSIHELLVMPTSAADEVSSPVAVSCHTDGDGLHYLDLHFPQELGRTAQGSCLIT